MATHIKRTSLPEGFRYNSGKYTYIYDPTTTAELRSGMIKEHQLKSCIVFEILSRNLKGKTDLHGNPYKPTLHVYRRIMGREQYEKRMKKHELAIDAIWQKMVNDTNQYKRDNADTGELYLGRQIEQFADDLVCKGAWIYDRLNGISPFHKTKGRLSMTTKLKRVLGYNV